MSSALPKSTLYFDRSCPLCRTEIDYYRRKDQDGHLCFIDISKSDALPPDGVSRARALQRFHVQAQDGRILSGAAAFIEVWARLPTWRWAARLASLPGVVPVLEVCYRMFLPVRPYLSRLVGNFVASRSAADSAEKGS